MSKFYYHNSIKVGLGLLLLAVAVPAIASASGIPTPTDAASVTPPPDAATAPAAPPAMAMPDTTAAPPTTALPSATQATAAAVPPGAAPPAIPALSETLNDQGATPGPLPPGFDLPLDDGSQSNTVIEKTPEEKQLEMRQKAFDAAVNGMWTLKPDEIRKMLELNDQTVQASETPLFPTPDMQSVFTTISLDPGSKPLVINTAIGSVTTLSMVDASGQPWPIRDLSWAGNFDIQQPETGSNMLRITPTSEFAFGNVSMRMIDLNPPIILVFKADRQAVHVRIDIQIPELGPNGVAPLIGGNNITTTAGNSQLASVLEGIAPASAKRLGISGVDGRTSVYSDKGVMYLRTPYTLLSPAWNSSVRSADGTNVYALPVTPVLLLSDKGRMVRASLMDSSTDQSMTTSMSGEEQTNGQ